MFKFDMKNKKFMWNKTLPFVVVMTRVQWHIYIYIFMSMRNPIFPQKKGRNLDSSLHGAIRLKKGFFLSSMPFPHQPHSIDGQSSCWQHLKNLLLSLA